MVHAQFAWRNFVLYKEGNGPLITLNLPDDYEKRVFRLNYPSESFSKAYLVLEYSVLNCEVPLKMGLAVNGDFLGYFSLNPNGGKLSIPIPTYLLKSLTIIELSVSLKTLETNCLGYIDITNMYIRGLINYLATPYIISQYPELILSKEYNPDGIIYFQLPARFSPVSSIGLSYIIEDLGSRKSENFPVIDIVSDVRSVRKGIAVIVGTPDEQYFDPALREVIRLSSRLILKRGRAGYYWARSNGTKIPDNVGIIITSNNSNGYPVLIVSGNSDNAVLNAAIALIQEGKNFVTNFELIEPGFIKFNRQPIILGPDPEYFFISDIYKGSTKFYGGKNTFYLPLRFLPGMNFLPYSQIMRLHLKASKFVNLSKSRLKITIDGELLFDESYIGPCSDSGKEVVIPWQSLKPENIIKFEFKTVPRVPLEDSSLLWVEILPRTNFKMTRKWVIEMPNLAYLKHYAFPFGYSPYKRKTYVVLSQFTADNFKVYLEFLRFVGSKQVFPEVPLLTRETLKGIKQLSQNAVMIGDFRPVKAPQPYIFEDIGKEKNAYLYLSYSIPEDARVFVKLFRIPEKLNAAYGNLAILNELGDIKNCKLTRRINYWGAPKAKFDMRYFFLQNYYRLLIIIPLVLIGIFIALTLLRYIVLSSKKILRARRQKPSVKRRPVSKPEPEGSPESKLPTPQPEVEEKTMDIKSAPKKKTLKRIKK